MKKLLLVLLVVTLASFLFVGCLPGVTPPAEGEGEGEGEAAICPTITITGQYAGTDKTYVKASGTAEVVITYTVPTEGVSIYLVTTSVLSPFLLPYYVSADGLVYTAAADLSGYDCEIIMIEVVDCYGECVCIESFVVDSVEPKAKMMLTVTECVCGDCEINITSDYTLTGTCIDTLGCCSDDCSGLASWSIDVYNTDPYDECCLIPCEEPIATCGTAACPIDCTTACVLGKDDLSLTYYILMTMLDNVGNSNKYWATIVFDSGCTAGADDFKWWDAPNKPPTGSLTNACIDWGTAGEAFVTDVTSGGLRYFIFGETCD
jgi:hypothetical protein